MMQDKLKPAVLGGVLLGLLSVIPVLNVCCCLWATLGGVLAAYLYLKNTPHASKSAGDGAVLGAIAGVAGGFLNFVIGVPLNIITNKAMYSLFARLFEDYDKAVAADFRATAEKGQTIMEIAVSNVMLSLLLIAFATIGGVLGMVLLGKNKNQPPTQPPPPPPPPTSSLPGYYPPTGASGNYPPPNSSQNTGGYYGR